MRAGASSSVTALLGGMWSAYDSCADEAECKALFAEALRIRTLEKSGVDKSVARAGASSSVTGLAGKMAGGDTGLGKPQAGEKSVDFSFCKKFGNKEWFHSDFQKLAAVYIHKITPEMLPKPSSLCTNMRSLLNGGSHGGKLAHYWRFEQGKHAGATELTKGDGAANHVTTLEFNTAFKTSNEQQTSRNHTFNSNTKKAKRLKV